ncbi:KPN_02809 family neutral zinc metallopeptidase [Pseudotabrizicola sp. L79]|uniref:KPN_02809 family neutral zinc metallopeptidase n=1 Tax=Pseudotabrizicola sp. L79 TaxID=3118402 RepID=UPI002F92A7D4
MQWRGRRGSRNIEDRRGQPARGGAAVGGLGVLAVVLIGYVLGIDVTPLLQDVSSPQSSQPRELSAEDQAAAAFVSVTLADTEEVWAELFQSQLGRAYRPATLVLFSGATQSPCGGANGATGPFYCPSDRKAYLDTDFFVTLERRLGAQGDFAAAYVVAHEIAHHVQNELGILGRVNQLRASASPQDSNALSVRVELQADCLSGVWARHASQMFGTIDRGDIEEAVTAARQIGDDTLQRAAGQRPMPHTFTHGSAEQRSRWFLTGLGSGQIGDCDTFSADNL